MKKHYPSSKILRRLSRSLAAGVALLACSPGSLHAQMPANLDFSSGNFSNWTCWVGISGVGTAATGTAFTSPAISAPIGGSAPSPWLGNKSRHAITSGTTTDYYGGFPVVCPSGGSNSARIGNDSNNYRADRIQYYVHVPASSTSYNIQYQFAAVLQDGFHPPAEQSSFQVIAYDSATGAVIPGANNLYIAKWAIPGFSPFIDPITSQVDSGIAWLPWTPSTINLSGMAGKTVVVECTALDCALSGHWGYGYLDVISVADSLVASLMRYSPSGDSVVLQGPPGYKTYRWYNQNFSTVFSSGNDTARTRTLPVPANAEYYNLVITPYASIGVPDTIRTPMLKSKLGVSSPLLAAVRVYPNPATTTMHISFAAPFDGTVILVNVSGESVYSKSLANSASYDIPTANFATGIYTLVLKDAQGASEVRHVSIKQ